MTTAAAIQELAADPRLIYRHTVAEYHQMIADGNIEEGSPYELLDGQIVRKVRAAVGEDPMSMETRHMAEAYERPLKGKGRYGHVQTLSAKEAVSVVMPARNTLKIPVPRFLPW